mmetsp:Transcript_15241/g.45360  ORF Transcript_15241/g.45360 Transcript_15241/m.45360 type:complete len:291 (+) Transcript_15241:133-1005(+)
MGGESRRRGSSTGSCPRTRIRRHHRRRGGAQLSSPPASLASLLRLATPSASRRARGGWAGTPARGRAICRTRRARRPTSGQRGLNGAIVSCSSQTSTWPSSATAAWRAPGFASATASKSEASTRSTCRTSKGRVRSPSRCARSTSVCAPTCLRASNSPQRALCWRIGCKRRSTRRSAGAARARSRSSTAAPCRARWRWPSTACFESCGTSTRTCSPRTSSKSESRSGRACSARSRVPARGKAASPCPRRSSGRRWTASRTATAASSACGCSSRRGSTTAEPRPSRSRPRP